MYKYSSGSSSSFNPPAWCLSFRPLWFFARLWSDYARLVSDFARLVSGDARLWSGHRTLVVWNRPFVV